MFDKQFVKVNSKLLALKVLCIRAVYIVEKAPLTTRIILIALYHHSGSTGQCDRRGTLIHPCKDGFHYSSVVIVAGTTHLRRSVVTTAAAAVVSAIGRLIFCLIFGVPCIFSLCASQYHVSIMVSLGKSTKKVYFVHININITVTKLVVANTTSCLPPRV